MAQNITIAGASYQDVPAVNLPKTGGGEATFLDAENYRTAAQQDVIDVGKQNTLISSGATVGQFARITSVDGDGKPTGWEPVSDNAVHYTTDTGKTDAEKGQARTNIDAAKTIQYELVETIVLTEEVSVIERTTDPQGNPYDFKTLFYNVETPPASSAAVAKCNYRRDGLWSMGTYHHNGLNTSKSYFAGLMEMRGSFVEMRYVYGSTSYYGTIEIRANATFVADKNPSYSYRTETSNLQGLKFSGVWCNFPVGTTIRIYGVRA